MNPQATDRGRRADASRNRDAIIDAGLRLLNENPAVSIAEIAAAAGVSRITFYGHFSSRDELLDAVSAWTMARVEAEIATIDVHQGPWPSLEALIQSQWRLVAEFSGVVRAAEQAAPERVRHHHAGPIARVQALMRAGREDGSFRTDQSLEWQIACFFAILHGAAAELSSGRLSEAEAATVIPETVHALLRPPS